MFSNPFFVIPAMFVILAGMLILHTPDQAQARRRFLLFLSIVGALSLMLIFAADQVVTQPEYITFVYTIYLLTPMLIGVLALSLLNIRHLAGMKRPAQTGVVLLLVIQLILVYLLRDSRSGVGYFVPLGVTLLVVGWLLGSRSRWLALFFSLIILIDLFLIYDFVSNPPSAPLPDYFRVPAWFGLYVVPGALAVLPAALIRNALQPDVAASVPSLRRWMQIGLLAVAAVLVVFSAYIIYWGAIWDQTSDGLFAVSIAQPVSIFAIGAGTLLAVAFRGRYRLVGLAYMVFIPLIPYIAMNLGWQTSYHEITEQRAERIAQALTRFQARESSYPETLAELTPGDLPSIEQPVILAGETWCYQGGQDYYRLAAFYREFFSAPVSLRVYEAAGKPPNEDWDCDGREAAMLERYPSPMDNPAVYQPVQPTALPTSEFVFPRTEVNPVLDGVRAAPGSWSPDSAYFFFGAQTVENGLTLHFLNGDTGETCPVEGQYSLADSLRRNHAWLPDDRVFYIDSSGQIMILIPCSDEVTDLTDHFTDTFTRISAFAPNTGRLLLQGKSTFWILDTRSLTMQAVTGVTPNPYDLHWDNFAWLPSGEQVVISHLNGRDRTEGSTLYLVDGDTGQAATSVSLDVASDQSAPWVEALIEQQVIVSGENRLLIADLSTQPPQVTDVITDIFDLDVQYPREVSVMGSYPDADKHGYYLLLRLNHPRNKALYQYHSVDGSIQVIDDGLPTLALLPDNQLWEMSPWEDQPSYRDEYKVITIATGASTTLQMPGHVPRNYPSLNFRYLAPQSQIVVASSQGISLHSLATGEVKTFWTLLPGDGFAPYLMAAPDGSALVASKDFGPLYWLPFKDTKQK